MFRWQTLLGQLEVKITCADSAQLLNALTNDGIRLNKILHCGNLDLLITIDRSDYKKLHQLTNKIGASLQICKRKGLYWKGKALLNRPVILTFLGLLIFVSFYLPSRVLFVEVEGNVTLPKNKIIEAAAESGIRFGASRRSVRSEVMKNALLERMPQLQWAGINTAGCTAIISVREKTVQEAGDTEKNQVSSIVAVRDGIIRNYTVFQGNPLCSVGQAVKAGQTLVSGYLDLGIVTKTTQAKAEIRALTYREADFVSPVPESVRGDVSAKKSRYALRIGKKLIKFYKDSGNVDTTCVKINTQTYLRLPGGFCLPVAVIKETATYYTSEERPAASESPEWLADYALNYLQDMMIAGQIVSSQTEMSIENDLYFLRGKYTCMEMIGRQKYEQTIPKDGSYD